MIVQWQNLRNSVTIIMQHPNVRTTPGCLNYLDAVLQSSNWGEALTNAAIEHAELLREAIQSSYSVVSKSQQIERLKQNLADLAAGHISQQHMTAAMAEQLQDVVIDLNNVLFAFCQVSSGVIFSRHSSIVTI